ncbi:hypothetical protein Goklo_007962, partial [Gossypium klotzschianum]|nr:hypothetical protein [Gossypium klotzschianum]
MDLNQSMEFTPSATSSPQIQNFMPITSFMLPFHQPSNEDGEEVKQSHLLVQKRSLELFWYQQMLEIHNISAFKSHHQLPLARIKRIMKSNKDVKRCDVSKAIRQEEALHFLFDVVPLINHKDDDGKFLEENEHHPVNQPQFPLLDMNAELVIRSPEAQQYMIKPPMSSH